MTQKYILELEEKIKNLELQLKEKSSKEESLEEKLINVQNELRFSVKKFKKVFDFSLLGQYIVSPELKIIDVNPAHLNLMRKNREDMIGTNILSHYSEEIHEFLRDEIRKIFETGFHESEIDIDILDDEKGSVERKSLIRRGISLSGVGYLGMESDITAIKRALEHVDEQSKSALVGQVAGKLAHDFNNILGGILGNAELSLIHFHHVEGLKDRLETIINLTKTGADLTRNLVTFARDQEVKQSYFKIGDKLDLVVSALKKDLDGIQVIRDYSSNIPKLLADPAMIERSLFNLIQNSIHAMSKTTNPVLTLKTFSNDEKISILIRDNGCGIPPQYLKEIFEPSFTLKGSKDEFDSYQNKIVGTGYGMSTVKKFIEEKHGGKVSLESKVNEGTSIVLNLKVAKNYLVENEIKQISFADIITKKNILIVEDEPSISEIQYNILSNPPFYHNVILAHTGQMALDMFNQHNFDFISLDYMLPGIYNGKNVYDQIRLINQTLPIVFISGSFEFAESIINLKLNDSYLGHLTKPMSNLDYAKIVNKYLNLVKSKKD